MFGYDGSWSIMSLSSVDEVGTDDVTQEIRGQ